MVLIVVTGIEKGRTRAADVNIGAIKQTVSKQKTISALNGQGKHEEIKMSLTASHRPTPIRAMVDMKRVTIHVSLVSTPRPDLLKEKTGDSYMSPA